MPTCEWDFVPHLPHPLILDATKTVICGTINFDGGTDCSKTYIEYDKNKKEVVMHSKPTHHMKSARERLNHIAMMNTRLSQNLVVVMQKRLNKKYRHDKHEIARFPLPKGVTVESGFIDPLTYQEMLHPVTHTCTLPTNQMHLSAGFGFFFMLLSDSDDAPIRSDNFNCTMNGGGAGFGSPFARKRPAGPSPDSKFHDAKNGPKSP